MSNTTNVFQVAHLIPALLRLEPDVEHRTLVILPTLSSGDRWSDAQHSFSEWERDFLNHGIWYWMKWKKCKHKQANP